MDFGGSEGRGMASRMSTRTRSKSSAAIAEPRNYTQDGRMIMHYCKFSEIPVSKIDLTLSSARAMYMYQAQIPEELSFAKGDILAVLRLQDDGWWEAEVVGRQNGRPGLVPSNYLQNC